MGTAILGLSCASAVNKKGWETNNPVPQRLVNASLQTCICDDERSRSDVLAAFGAASDVIRNSGV